VGDIQSKRDLLKESFALLDRPELADVDTRSERAFVLSTMVRSGFHAEYEQAKRAGQQSLALYEALGDRASMALALEAWGHAASGYGALEEAEKHLERSLEMRRSSGDRLGVATSLKFLSWGATLHLGYFERAERYARESLVIRQELLGAPGDGLEVLGWTVAHRGRYGEARSMIAESAAAYEDRGARFGYLIASFFLGVVQVHLGRYVQARDRSQACFGSCRSSGFRLGAAWYLVVLGMATLGTGQAEEACQFLEESLSIFQGIVARNFQSWALAFPGYAAHRLGRLCQAQQCFGQALRMAAEIRSLWALLYALPGAASLLADQGEVERAVEVYALASRYPFVANSRWFEDVAGKHVAAAAAALPPEVVAAAQKRGRARDPWVTADELLIELENGESCAMKLPS
jgi:tetratricopeptide (TPR) repeat protein